jgi:hypothetical protein
MRGRSDMLGVFTAGAINLPDMKIYDFNFILGR